MKFQKVVESQSADVKPNVRKQEIKGLVTVSCNFL